jgi:hypothetical protein
VGQCVGYSTVQWRHRHTLNPHPLQVCADAIARVRLLHGELKDMLFGSRRAEQVRWDTHRTVLILLCSYTGCEMGYTSHCTLYSLYTAGARWDTHRTVLCTHYILQVRDGIHIALYSVLTIYCRCEMGYTSHYTLYSLYTAGAGWDTHRTSGAC